MRVHNPWGWGPGVEASDEVEADIQLSKVSTASSIHPTKMALEESRTLGPPPWDAGTLLKIRPCGLVKG